jgi:hypothetical protein
MKKLIFLLFAIIAPSSILLAQPPAGKANKGDNYGAKVNPQNAENAAVLTKVLNVPDTLSVKVKGKVTDVCSAKGCWMTVQVNDSTEAFVKMKDYGFFVPLALKGKMVVVEGVSFRKITSVADQKHYAEDAGKSEKEIAAITQPKKEIRIMASGIIVAE